LTAGQGPRFVSVNGTLRKADAAHLSAFDRGFQLGDGVFETMRARGGRVTELAEHLARLRRSAEGLGFSLPSGLEGWIPPGIAELLTAEGLGGSDGDASLRITVSRGTFFGRGLLPPDVEPVPTIVLQAWPVPPTPADHLERGLHLVVSAVRRDPSSPLAALKTTSRADYVYARLEARRAGADDALFLTTDGRLSEATSANVFLVRGTELATPALDCAILPGTTRSWILRWAGAAGLTAVERSLAPDDLAAADEAFLCSSVAGILPATRFEGAPVGSGLPGPWTMQARDAREAFIAGEDASR
jgi:branched-chain amino acid aminotransferase